MRVRHALAAALLVPAWAQAQPAAPADGFAVTAPPGYAVRSVPPNRGQAARFEVKAPTDTDTGCMVAFSLAPRNKGLSQAELDAAMRDRPWQDAARETLEALYDIREAAVAGGSGHPAFVMVGDIKPRPGLPARAQDIRTLLAIQETPEVRTTTACVGERATFDARRAEFMAVVAGTKVP